MIGKTFDSEWINILKGVYWTDMNLLENKLFQAVFKYTYIKNKLFQIN